MRPSLSEHLTQDYCLVPTEGGEWMIYRHGYGYLDQYQTVTSITWNRYRDEARVWTDVQLAEEVARQLGGREPVYPATYAPWLRWLPRVVTINAVRFSEKVQDYRLNNPHVLWFIGTRPKDGQVPARVSTDVHQKLPWENVRWFTAKKCTRLNNEGFFLFSQARSLCDGTGHTYANMLVGEEHGDLQLYLLHVRAAKTGSYLATQRAQQTLNLVLSHPTLRHLWAQQLLTPTPTPWPTTTS